jgi:hypothetical protein
MLGAFLAPVRLLAETEVTLDDGSVLVGEMVSESDSTIVIESSTLGRLTIARDVIRHVRSTTPISDAKVGWRSDPDYNSLVFVPTSETLSGGDVYYRNFELLFNNFGYAPTDALNLSVMAAFPITDDVRIVGGGAKMRLVSRDVHGVGFAVAGGFIQAVDTGLGSITAATSFGSRRTSLTLAGSYAFSEDEGHGVVMGGFDHQISRGMKIVAEYGNSADALVEDESFIGIIGVGIRAFWESTSFTLIGLRPLQGGEGLFAFPVASFSAHF